MNEVAAADHEAQCLTDVLYAPGVIGEYTALACVAPQLVVGRCREGPVIYPERSPFGVAVDLEYRGDRGRDQNVSTMMAANGTLVATGDIGFCCAAMAAVLAQWEAA